jgi:predicted site-specific integrase-resolvase
MPLKVKAHVAATHYGVSLSNLRKWAREGAIPTERTPGGHYVYVLPDSESAVPTEDTEWTENIVYARVSSRKRTDDLERQAKRLVGLFPGFTLVKDIGSGINYQRRGFRTLLERLFEGKVKRVVVAHRDRFSRFGFDFFEWLFARFGAVLESVEQPSADTGEDMVADIMEVFTVFSARYYGRRKYHPHKEAEDLSDDSTKGALS